MDRTDKVDNIILFAVNNGANIFLMMNSCNLKKNTILLKIETFENIALKLKNCIHCDFKKSLTLLFSNRYIVQE